MSGAIYLDNAATTPVDASVIDAMSEVLRETPALGNPASAHAPGRRAAALVADARGHVAALLGASPEAVVFTSGATEADNLAVLGGARAQCARGRGNHIVTVATEHQAVLAPCERLAREGFGVTRIMPDADGRVPVERLEAALDSGTALVSVMHVNNETGVIQAIAELGAAAHQVGALMHVDAAQSAGRLPLDTAALPVDLISLSAHKLHGPPGVGALYVRQQPRARLESLALGGGQESGLRAGTVPSHQVVGMGEACRLAKARQTTDAAYLVSLRERLERNLDGLEGIVRNGRADGAAHILNVACLGVHGDALRADLEALAVSAGSACSAREPGVSHVLRAMGLPDALAGASLRLSLGRRTQERDIDGAVHLVARSLARLRRFSPLWRELCHGARAETLYASPVPFQHVA